MQGLNKVHLGFALYMAKSQAPASRYCAVCTWNQGSSFDLRCIWLRTQARADIALYALEDHARCRFCAVYGLEPRLVQEVLRCMHLENPAPFFLGFAL